jgi:hypothetical protein
VVLPRSHQPFFFPRGGKAIRADVPVIRPAASSARSCIPQLTHYKPPKYGEW